MTRANGDSCADRVYEGAANERHQDRSGRKGERVQVRLLVVFGFHSLI